MPFIRARRLRRARLGVVPCPPPSSKLMLLTLHLAKTHKILLTKTGGMRGGTPTYEKNKLQQERHLFTLIASQQITLFSCWRDQRDGAEQSKTKLTTYSRVLEKEFLLYPQIDCFINPGYFLPSIHLGKSS